jgi:glutamate racemase
MFGIFDSGVGGLSVARLIKRNFPQENFLYLGDTAHFPYGEKSAANIKDYAIKNVKFLIDNGASVIIIACHTASALAANHLRKQFPHIPIFDIITPAIDEIRERGFKKIGIIGTRGTIKSNIYQRKLNNIANQVIAKPCPLLVSLVEEGWIGKPETFSILKHYLKFVSHNSLRALVLSCTHYSLIEKQISQVVGNDVQIIEPAKILIKAINNRKEMLGKNKKSQNKYWVTDFPARFERLSKIFLDREVIIQKANIR